MSIWMKVWHDVEMRSNDVLAYLIEREVRILLYFVCATFIYL